VRPVEVIRSWKRNQDIRKEEEKMRLLSIGFPFSIGQQSLSVTLSSTKK